MGIAQIRDELLSAYAELRRFLLGRLRNAEDAADVAQASFERAYAYALASPVDSPRALLFSAARNLCIDEARHGTVTRAWLEERIALDAGAAAPSAEHVAAQHQLLDRVAEGLEALPARRREVFLLARVDGLSRSEIASQLGITEAAVAKHLARAMPHRTRLRSALAALAFVAAGAASLFAWHVRQPLHERAAQTGTAQVARLALPDGSRIDVNAQSAVHVAYYRDRRVVELQRGEARFDVSRDASRPFRVVTRGGTVEVLGTAFVVADRRDRIVVEVEHGRVRVQPPEPGVAVELTGGERVILRDGGAANVEPLGAREPGAWRDGWLVFDNEPLGDALASINAFRGTPLSADARAASLRLTGRFRATDSQSLLSALPKILPVEVEPRPDGGARIHAR